MTPIPKEVETYKGAIIQKGDRDIYDQIEELKNKMDSMVDPEKFKALEEERNKLLKDYINKRLGTESKAYSNIL